MLPQLAGELLAMQRCKRELDDVRGELLATTRASAGNGHVRDEASLARKRRRAEALVEQLNDWLARINGRGIELKDLDQGLIDFRSDRGGRIVYLCWRLGEERIAWWHDLDAGFGGRQPL